ncbi:hypothetical protein FMEAI12_3340009 [Parafrankia sp. Ea1.12]|nr:hypothetical protein FMEAI12_3340009 [Parafrankia sp. Ea1.12]
MPCPRLPPHPVSRVDGTGRSSHKSQRGINVPSNAGRAADYLAKPCSYPVLRASRARRFVVLVRGSTTR